MSVWYVSPYAANFNPLSHIKRRTGSKHPQLDNKLNAVKFSLFYGAGPNAIARILGQRKPCTRKAIPSRNKREGQYIGHAYGKAVRYVWNYRIFHCVCSMDARWFHK